MRACKMCLRLYGFRDSMEQQFHAQSRKRFIKVARCHDAKAASV